MKTAMQKAIKEIAELWSSPSDTRNYTQIFKVLESKLEPEKEQIKDAFRNGSASSMLGGGHWTQYYNQKYK